MMLAAAAIALSFVLGEAKQEVAVDVSENVALLVIDMQNDFCHEKGVLIDKVGFPPICSAVIPNIKTLADVATKARIPTFWITADYEHANPAFDSVSSLHDD